MGDVGAPKMTR